MHHFIVVEVKNGRVSLNCVRMESRGPRQPYFSRMRTARQGRLAQCLIKIKCYVHVRVGRTVPVSRCGC